MQSIYDLPQYKQIQRDIFEDLKRRLAAKIRAGKLTYEQVEIALGVRKND